MTNIELWRKREKRERDISLISETNSDFVYEDRNEHAKHQEK
jgi:hypothetical protein